MKTIQAQPSAPAQTSVMGAGFFDTAEGIDLSRADFSHEELTVAVTTEQVDEFTCGSCFLVRHRSQLACRSGEVPYCTDWEG